MKLACVLAAATTASAWMTTPSLAPRATSHVSKARRLSAGLKLKIADDITEVIGNTPMVRLKKVSLSIHILFRSCLVDFFCATSRFELWLIFF